MEGFSFFGALALIILVLSPFVFAEDLCENVSRSYEDLCREIIKADIRRGEKIDLIENIDQVETYEPISESRLQKDFCSENDCLIPDDLEHKVDENKLDFLLQVVVIFLIFFWMFILIKKYGGKAWRLVDS